MQINDVMTHRVSYVSSDASLSEAVRVMCTDDVAYLPVCEHGRVAGSITQHDIVTHGMTQSGSPDNTSVRAIMSGDTSAVWIDADIDEEREQRGHASLFTFSVLDSARAAANQKWSAPNLCGEYVAEPFPPL